MFTYCYGQLLSIACILQYAVGFDIIFICKTGRTNIEEINNINILKMLNLTLFRSPQVKSYMAEVLYEYKVLNPEIQVT